MSVLVPSFPSSTNTHHHYFPNNLINGNLTQSTKQMPLINRLTSKLNGDNENDHVPFGVVNSMKQRLLDKVNESLLLNNNSTSVRQSLSKSSSRVLSNDNLLQSKPLISPLKCTTRLSRSQDSLLHNNNNSEQLTSYLQPKQDVIIVNITTLNDENISIHRHSYTELHVDEVPKPGTVTTVKNMFERQIRLSRFDSDKLSNASIPPTLRVNNHHREIISPHRSRSISPNDMALRQRRIGGAATSTTATLLLPLPTSYPDLVMSHTPPILPHIEMNKISHEQSVINMQNDNKEKDISSNEMTIMNSDHNRPNLLLSSTTSSDIVDYQPLDFKSRLALFNHTNTIERSNEHSSNSINIKKPSQHSYPAPPPPQFLTKPIVHHHHHTEKKESPSDEIIQSFVNTTKAVTFFGGTKLNELIQSTLPPSIIPPPPPIIKEEQSSLLTSIDLFNAPDIIGGDVKLSRSSIFSGIKKDARVQFIENVDTFEYPSFTIAIAEFDGTPSDDDDDDEEEEEEEDDDNSSTNDYKNSIKTTDVIENVHDPNDDVDDDELERLARVNAKFNSNNLTEKTIQPKGTLHTFRPTHLDQYELGMQHESLSYSNLSSDIFSHKNYFSSSNNFINHSSLKQQKSPFDMTNNIQWSSMSTTTDLLF